MTEGDDILSRFFSSKSKYVKDDKTQKSVKGIFTRCRMTVKNINKNTSAKNSNQNGKPALKCRKSPPIFSFGLSELAKEPHLKAERATVAAQLWPFCKPIWAVLSAFSGPNPCQQNSSN